MSDEIRGDEAAPRAISRRDVLKRGAIVGGALWAAPVIQSLTNAAHAQNGSPVAIDHFCCQCSDGPAPDPTGVCNGAATTPTSACDCAAFCDGNGYDTFEFCEFTGTEGFQCGDTASGDCEHPGDATCTGPTDASTFLAGCP